MGCCPLKFEMFMYLMVKINLNPLRTNTINCLRFTINRWGDEGGRSASSAFPLSSPRQPAQSSEAGLIWKEETIFMFDMVWSRRSQPQSWHAWRVMLKSPLLSRVALCQSIEFADQSQSSHARLRPVPAKKSAPHEPLEFTASFSFSLYVRPVAEWCVTHTLTAQFRQAGPQTRMRSCFSLVHAATLSGPSFLF